MVITAYPCGHDAGETIQNPQACTLQGRELTHSAGVGSLFLLSLGSVSWSLPSSFSRLPHIYWPFRAHSKTTTFTKIFSRHNWKILFPTSSSNFSGIYHFLSSASVILLLFPLAYKSHRNKLPVLQSCFLRVPRRMPSKSRCPKIMRQLCGGQFCVFKNPCLVLF